MILVVEGVKQVGKTTVCGMLQCHGFIYYKDDTFHRMIGDEIQAGTKGGLLTLTKVLETINEQRPEINVCIDRFHLSEYTFGKVERNYSGYFCKEIDERLSKIGAKLLYLFDNMENIKGRCGKDFSEHIKVMDKFFESSGMTKTKMKVFGFNPLEIYELITMFAES